MTKNLVLTIAVGENYEKMSVYTHPRMKEYAKRIGADFEVITSSNSSSPHWEKFMIAEYLNKYERVLYIDTDILIRDDCPSLFDVVPYDKLGMFNELPFTESRQVALVEACKDYNIKLPKWNGKYYNSGVIVVPRRWKFLFKKPEKEFFNFYEQSYLNVKIHEQLETIGNELSVFDLEYQYNRMSCMDKFTGEERYASYIMHYAGFPSLNDVYQLIRLDDEKWKSDKGNYKYKRHIVLDVQGGLGDQLEAQPGIRYLLKHIYPDDDVNIKTHFPEIFDGIHDKVFLHGKFQPSPDTPYYWVNTLPGPETSMWNHVSNLLCHTVDYCAMSMIRCTLPHKDKNIKINIKKEALEEVKKICGEDLENLVLVHAGKHWESKTFPISYWQNIVDSLQEEGYKVCLIGKNEESRGVVNLEVRDGVIDTRDLLTLEELFALISKAKILLSNDSAPVHIAGAFDNWIVLIPSCKHPDHILPYRNGNIFYKTKSVYKKLTLDDIQKAPTAVHGSSGKHIVGKWEEYLPEVKEVIEKIKECK